MIRPHGVRRSLPLSALFILLFALPPELSAQTYIYNRIGLAVGNNPAAITLVDFNSDGRIDIAVPNSNDNSVSVVIARSDGTFAPKVDYPVGTSPAAVVSGDFNGDNVPDLAVVNGQDDTVSILIGVGDGTFSSQVTYSTGVSPVAIVAVDLDGDKKLDLAEANQNDGTVSVLHGNGDGTFRPQSTITTAPVPIALVAGDLNGDGATDLVALTQGNLSIALNNGHGGFTVSNLALSGASIAIGDLNSDGNPDLVLTDPANHGTRILFGNGSGGFQLPPVVLPAPNIAPNTAPKSVAIGDLDGDGILDIVLSAGRDDVSSVLNPSSILIFLGNGAGTFQPPIVNGYPDPRNPADPSFPDALPLLAVGDFNNDNHLDVAALDASSQAVIILLGKGNGVIVDSPSDIVLPNAQKAVAGTAEADFNADGKLDLALALFDQAPPPAGTITGFVAVLPGNGDGTFQPAVSTPDPNIGLGQMVAGDFNGDGKIDIAMARPYPTGGVQVMLGNGDGTFASPVASPVNLPALNTQNMIAGDFNHDGKTDLALLSLQPCFPCSPLYVLVSNGDGTFRPNLVEDEPPIAFGLTAGDFNHDGNLDIAVTGGDAAIHTYLGHGDGAFTILPPIPAASGFLEAADFNGDGNLDLAGLAGSVIPFLAGNGDGTFRSPVQTPVEQTLSASALILGDFNGDGKPDLAFTGGTPAIALGIGDGTFQAPIPFQVFSQNGFATAGQFRPNSGLDLVTFSINPGLSTPLPLTATFWYSTPTVSFSAAKLDFGSQNLGTSSSPRSLLLTNVGNAPLSISGITITGNFSQTNNCPSSLAIAQQCSFSVTFTPTANGASAGNLRFSDNSSPGTQLLALSGWTGAADFSISAGHTAASVIAGNAASDVITIASGGGFIGNVQLACTGIPLKATCALSRSAATLGGSSGPSSVNVTVTINTTAATVAKLSRPDEPPSRRSPSSTWIIGLAPVAVFFLAKRRRIAGTIGMAVIALGLISCGGGGNSGGGGVSGTPPGTYNVTITGTSGNTTHSVTIALTVT